ncbi:g1527 [Coccomyxa viridis]|uniref:G1527 protein n=1 Tax=Coccomyxa viridis TaxID=1274662 RepID=A0ABP1FQ05_9CHLO
MHATRRTPVDDPDLEDIVVYADEDSRNGRIAQDQQTGQNVRQHPPRSYVHLQQQLQSTSSATVAEGWSMRSRRNEMLGDSAKMNLQQQFEQSVAADRGGSTLQRLLGHNSITSLDDQAGSLPLAHRQDPAVASSLHGNGSYRFGVCLALHSSPPERMTQAGPQERQKPVGTARKGAHKASFAIREPQPAGLSLKASLQQLRGTTNSSQAPGGREKPAEDAIMSNAEEERQSHSSPLPSPPQAVLHTPIPGEPRETGKGAGGMSAQRNFLASVLKPGKRQNLSIPQQVPKRTGRAAGMNGPLTGRLHSILQEEEHLSSRGDGKQFFQVQVTQREQQGSIVTCRCSVVSGSTTSQSIIALFRSSIALDTNVGSRVTICSPWRECTVPGTAARVIFVLAAHSCTET